MLLIFSIAYAIMAVIFKSLFENIFGLIYSANIVIFATWETEF